MPIANKIQKMATQAAKIEKLYKTGKIFKAYELMDDFADLVGEIADEMATLDMPDTPKINYNHPPKNPELALKRKEGY